LYTEAKEVISELVNTKKGDRTFRGKKELTTGEVLLMQLRTQRRGWDEIGQIRPERVGDEAARKLVEAIEHTWRGKMG